MDDNPYDSRAEEEAEIDRRYCHLQDVFCRVEQERDEYRLQRDLHMAAANKAEADLARARRVLTMLPKELLKRAAGYAERAICTEECGECDLNNSPCERDAAALERAAQALEDEK